MSTMRKYLCWLIICLVSIPAFANGTFTNLEKGIKVYSEYYPNPAARFKGTIVFINGSGSDISVWKKPELFQCAKEAGSLFFYERNGIGKSPADFSLSGTQPLTAKKVSDRLTLLLQKQRIKPPYLLVAHSHGALYAVYFALKNPARVAGLLLVDPIPRDASFSAEAMKKMQQGLRDAKTKSSQFVYKKYTGSQAEAFYQILGLDESRLSIKKAGNIDNAIPVIVLSSKEMAQTNPMQEDWYENQQKWLNGNPLSKIISVSADHFIQITQPLVVCDELKNILLHKSL